jgi:hypothetical protein
MTYGPPTRLYHTQWCHPGDTKPPFTGLCGTFKTETMTGHDPCSQTACTVEVRDAYAVSVCTAK